MTCLKAAVCYVRIDEETTESVILSCIQTLIYSELKGEQLKVIMKFLSGSDIFAVLPTVFGKTLCYACLPYIFDKLTRTASRHRTLDAILNATCISPQDSNKFNILIAFQLHKFSLRM